MKKQLSWSFKSTGVEIEIQCEKFFQMTFLDVLLVFCFAISFQNVEGQSCLKGGKTIKVYFVKPVCDTPFSRVENACVSWDSWDKPRLLLKTEV